MKDFTAENSRYPLPKDVKSRMKKDAQLDQAINDYSRSKNANRNLARTAGKMEAIKVLAHDFQLEEPDLTLIEAYDKAEEAYDHMNAKSRQWYLRMAIADDPEKKQERIETRVARRENRTGIVGNLAKQTINSVGGFMQGVAQ